MAIKAIIGLGNPGKEYEHTRHNAGEDFVIALAEQFGGHFKKEDRFFGMTATATIHHQAIRLLLPGTYMNRSGQAVAALSNFYRIETDEILVVHDELDLAPGTARLKKAGGHGGHNGLRDIISSLGNNNGFLRLRIGIGHPGQARQVSSYVLKKPPPDEQLLIRQSMEDALRVIPDLIKGDWEKATRDLHSLK
ncbi:MAG: aminoacyl-tRNA hydrolase [Pseudomonadales bacterium]|nr:aminoacyl-tRNA hydrolase [Pseudomonadales bacterium]